MKEENKTNMEEVREHAHLASAPFLMLHSVPEVVAVGNNQSSYYLWVLEMALVPAAVASSSLLLFSAVHE